MRLLLLLLLLLSRLHCTEKRSAIKLSNVGNGSRAEPNIWTDIARYKTDCSLKKRERSVCFCQCEPRMKRLKVAAVDCMIVRYFLLALFLFVTHHLRNGQFKFILRLM